MNIQIIKDRSALEKYFRQDPSLHLYSLGDLDDFYWPRITCYGIQDRQKLKNITPVYRGENLPVLLGFGDLEREYLRQLQSLLPDRFYTHLSPGLIDHFSENYLITEHGDHYKMSLVDLTQISQIDINNTIQLSENDLQEVVLLYRESYPDNAFDPRMLKSGQYIGIRQQGKLVSIAGVHTYSKAYKVAALGNITTHPNYRNQGFGKAVTAHLCQLLTRTVDFIGLHVKCDNQGAISLYKSLGFRISNVYGEFSLQKGPK